MNNSARSTRRRPVLAAVCVIALCAVAYDVFFHVHAVGPRSVIVNGESVEQIAGFTVRSTTWLAEAQVSRFLRRVGATGVALPTRVKTYRGQDYVPAVAVAASLTQHGDGTRFADGRLSVALPATQHYQYAANGDLIRQQQVVAEGRAVGRVLAVVHDEALYLPIAAVANLLSDGTSLASSWNGTSLRFGASGQAGPVPIQARDAVTSISFDGDKAIYAPRYTWQGQTYLPAYSLGAALRQSGYASATTTWAWTVQKRDTGIGTQSGSAAKPTVLAFVPSYFGDLAAFADVTQHPESYNALAADIWTVDAAGGLDGSAPAGATSQAAANGDAVYAMVTNLGASGFNAAEMTAVLSDADKSGRLQDAIVQLVDTEGFDGATLDFESLSPSDRARYTRFVTQLAAALHARGKRLDVVVPPVTDSDSEPWNRAYDQAQLGAVADDLIVMAYDYSYIGGSAGPIAPIPWVQQTLAYTVSRVPSTKVLLGVDAYGYDWAGKHTTAVGLNSVDSFVATHHIQTRWDAAAEAPWYQWTDSQGTVHTVYYENGKSTAAKVDLARLYGIAGVALWRAGLEDEAVLQVLAQYAR